MTDIGDTLAPKSDQLDAVDLLGAPPRVFTITQVDVSDNPHAEQPVTVHLAEFPRVWRPNLSMRRVLSFCWGVRSAAYIGRRVELYCDERVVYGGNVVGGIRISRLSDITERRTVPLLVAKGRGGSWTVDPLPDAAPAEPSPAELAAQVAAGIEAAATADEVREWGNRAHARGLLDLIPEDAPGDPTLRQLVEARLAALAERDAGEEASS